MLCRTLADLEGLAHARIDGGEPSEITMNALLESWAVHSRVLREFLFSDSGNARRDGDDVLAQDLFNDDEWESIRRRPGAALSKVSARVGKEIAHLTYTRNSVKPEDRGLGGRGDHPRADGRARIVPGPSALQARPARSS